MHSYTTASFSHRKKPFFFSSNFSSARKYIRIAGPVCLRTKVIGKSNKLILIFSAVSYTKNHNSVELIKLSRYLLFLFETVRRTYKIYNILLNFHIVSFLFEALLRSRHGPVAVLEPAFLTAEAHIKLIRFSVSGRGLVLLRRTVSFLLFD